MAGSRTFTVQHTDGADDVPALTAALATGKYSANTTILFKKGTTYNLFTSIKFPSFTNVEVAIEGNLTYPDDIAAIQALCRRLVSPGHGGTNVTLRGTTDPEWGWVDGHGQQWWDAMEQTNRPHGWAFSKISHGAIHNMKLWKPIAWNFATSGASNIHVYNNIILAKSDTDSFPFNTYVLRFSAGGSDLLLEGNHIVNGDDCLTVGSGAKNIHWRNNYCEGGHGLSIGSLGKGGSVADVQNVLIENVVMVNSLYAARFKSWTGGNGLARNITWKNILFKNVMFPIYVTQNYWDQGLGAPPNTSSPNNTRIQDFVFKGFSGTINDTPGYVEGSCISDPYAVEGATGKEVIILDLYPDTATNVFASDISAKTLSGDPVMAMCNSTTITSNVGFKCWDGLFEPTRGGHAFLT
ncbi:pectin lyase fold/virulence factor [Epithele typhae]|uniref:pectin lyase fold/virulence factor n=1 Tax=Epithele typhae TaxID=378194 RepID=UPI0020082C6D|nr:pectin lyase fold/virulence factor [Epithele typhae]KAH9932134.1 pectin lyase fold/virulence factor [Epithele typhae]